MQSDNSRTALLRLLAVGFFLLIIAFHLTNALTGHALIRPSHLGVALEYAHGQINLLRPVITGFNANGTPTAQELPLWQAAAALVFKITNSTWYGWANFVSLIFFVTGLWPLFQLARHYIGERAAWWTLIFFLAQPLVVVLAGKAATDGFCLMLTLWFLFFTDKATRTNHLWWWLPALFFACLSAVEKAPFFMTAGLGAAGMLRANNVRAWRSWLMLATTGAIATIVFLGWTRYCDSLSAQAEYPYTELRISENPFMNWWYFGDWHMRSSPGIWLKGLWRFLHATLGSLPFVVILLVALFSKGNRFSKYWLLATVATTLVFTHLVLIHWHYYLMCCPAVAMLCGVTLARWENSLSSISSRWWLAILSGIALTASCLDGIIAMKIGIDYDPFPKDMAAVVHRYTAPQDKLIVFKCDPEWPGEVLFRADRNGFYVPTLESPTVGPTKKGLLELLTAPADLQRLQALGYTKLVLMSESPAQFAAQAVNPGSHRRRVFYPETISPSVDDWPVVYRSADILIKEIPQ